MKIFSKQKKNYDLIRMVSKVVIFVLEGGGGRICVLTYKWPLSGCKFY